MKKEMNAKKSIFTRLIDITILVIFIIAAILICAGLIKGFIYNKFIPGTEIGGIDVSRKTVPQAEILLREAVKKYSKTPIKIKLDGTEKEIPAENLGITFLINETITKAKNVDDNKKTIRAYFFPVGEKTETTIIISIDKQELIGKLNEEFSLNNLKAKNAWYEFDNKGRLQVTDGQDGLEINKKELYESLRNATENLEGHTITASFIAQKPNITKEDMEFQKESIIQSLKHKMTFSHPEYRNRWTLSLITHLDWVTFSTKQKIIFDPLRVSMVINKFPKINTPGFTVKTYITIEIDKEKLNEFIDKKMAQYLDVPTENVNIYKDDKGQIIIEGRGDNGKKIQRDLFKKAIELAITNRINTVPIPVIEVEPTITVSEELQALGIKERLSIGHTTFYGSPLNRIYNIGVGARKINGTLIKPEEIFSFNKTLGAVNSSTGYLTELVIKPEGTIPEFGGGLCQVSTTTYRSALFAGLPIKERYQHSYAVTYYSQVLGHGLDATVYIGGPDLKFENDTGHHMLLQAYTKNKHELYIILYGTDDGRQVEMDGPYISNKTNPSEVVYQEVGTLPLGVQKKIERAHIGFNALWYRYITMPNGEKKTEEITSKYQTMPAKVQVGTKKPAGQ